MILKLFFYSSFSVFFYASCIFEFTAQIFVKQSASSSGFPATVTMLLLFVLALKILVVLILMFSHVCAETKFSISVLSCLSS